MLYILLLICIRFIYLLFFPSLPLFLLSCLFCFVLVYPVLTCPGLYRAALICPVLPWSILCCPVLFCPVLPWSILCCTVLSFPSSLEKQLFLTPLLPVLYYFNGKVLVIKLIFLIINILLPTEGYRQSFSSSEKNYMVCLILMLIQKITPLLPKPEISAIFSTQSGASEFFSLISNILC